MLLGPYALRTNSSLARMVLTYVSEVVGSVRKVSIGVVKSGRELLSLFLSPSFSHALSPLLSPLSASSSASGSWLFLLVIPSSKRLWVNQRNVSDLFHLYLCRKEQADCPASLFFSHLDIVSFCKGLSNHESDLITTHDFLIR